MATKTVDEYIQKHPQWEEELSLLRSMLRSTEMEETIKWGAPAYTFNSKNVVGLAAFKNHCALWFWQGALLKENTALLHNAQDGKTQAMRQIRFEKGDEINTGILRNYIDEAIRNAREGKTIKLRTPEAEIPDELETAFKADNQLKDAFKSLTPGRQKEYADYISSAKRQDTRNSRLEKIIPMIKEGKGLNDKYK